MSDSFISQLPAGLNVQTDAASLARYSSDASGLKAGTPLLVARPASVAQVAELVGLCATHNKKITIAGGGSGLAGGASPNEGDVVISLELLNQIEEIDEAGGTALVQAGV